MGTINHANIKSNDTQVAISVLAKIDFKARKMGIKITLNNNKKNNLPRRHNNLSYVCSKQHSFKICEVETNKNERTNIFSQLHFEDSTMLSRKLT